MLPLALIAASLAFIAVLIWRAPMGWEDSTGFHLGIPPAASTPAGRAPGVTYLPALGAHSVSSSHEVRNAR